MCSRKGRGGERGRGQRHPRERGRGQRHPRERDRGQRHPRERGRGQCHPRERGRGQRHPRGSALCKRAIPLCWRIFLTHKPKLSKGTEFSQQTLVYKSLYLCNAML